MSSRTLCQSLNRSRSAFEQLLTIAPHSRTTQLILLELWTPGQSIARKIDNQSDGKSRHRDTYAHSRTENTLKFEQRTTSAYPHILTGNLYHLQMFTVWFLVPLSEYLTLQLQNEGETIPSTNKTPTRWDFKIQRIGLRSKAIPRPSGSARSGQKKIGPTCSSKETTRGCI